MFTRIVNSSTFQSVTAALGRGLVMAALAYGGMLLKHVTDRDTLIGTLIVVALIPLAGVLHLVVPAIPPGVAMAARWPRIGEPVLPIPPPPDAPRPEQSSDHVAAAVQRDRAGRFAPRVIPPAPPA